MTELMRWRHADDVAMVSDVDRVAVINLSRLDEPPVILTGTAAVIWGAVDGTCDDDAVASRVAAVYEVRVEEIKDVVLTFLQHLAACQLLSRA